jgi:hypothetical protein
LKSKSQGGRKIGKEDIHMFGSYTERFIRTESEEMEPKGEQ